MWEKVKRKGLTTSPSNTRFGDISDGTGCQTSNKQKFYHMVYIRFIIWWLVLCGISWPRDVTDEKT